MITKLQLSGTCERAKPEHYYFKYEDSIIQGKHTSLVKIGLYKAIIPVPNESIENFANGFIIKLNEQKFIFYSKEFKRFLGEHGLFFFTCKEKLVRAINNLKFYNNERNN